MSYDLYVLKPDVPEIGEEFRNRRKDMKKN